jgi:hypothetical protein
MEELHSPRSVTSSLVERKWCCQECILLVQVMDTFEREKLLVMTLLSYLLFILSLSYRTFAEPDLLTKSSVQSSVTGLNRTVILSKTRHLSYNTRKWVGIEVRMMLSFRALGESFIALFFFLLIKIHLLHTLKILFFNLVRHLQYPALTWHHDHQSSNALAVGRPRFSSFYTCLSISLFSQCPSLGQTTTRRRTAYSELAITTIHPCLPLGFIYTGTLIFSNRSYDLSTFHHPQSRFIFSHLIPFTTKSKPG